MGTLTQPVSGLSSSDPVPGAYLEVLFAQGPVTSDGSTKKVLFIGPKTSSGSATNDTQLYLLGTLDDTIDRFGAGSGVHRAHRRFLETCKTAIVYGISPAESTNSAAANASNTVTFTGTASKNGLVKHYICGEEVQTGITKDSTAGTIASAHAAQINLKTWLPVTAAASGGVVTLTAKLKGTNGNAIRQFVEIASGITTTVSAGNETLTGGVQDESYTTALSTIEATEFSKIIPCLNVTGTADTRVGSCQAQIVSQAEPVTGIRQQLIVGHAGTSADAITFAAATNGLQNKARCQCVWQERSQWEPMELAAHFAGVRYSKEAGDPGYNFDDYGKGVNDTWNVPKQYTASYWPTRSEISTAISGGLTPIAVSGERTYLVRSVTASTDVRVRDTSKVTVADQFAADLAARYASQWSGAKVQDDPSNDNVQVANNVCTPDRLKGFTIIPLYKQYANDGWLDSDKTLDSTTGDIVACATGIDPNNATRINARIPLHVTPLLHQFAAVVSENSAG